MMYVRRLTNTLSIFENNFSFMFMCHVSVLDYTMVLYLGCCPLRRPLSSCRQLRRDVLLWPCWVTNNISLKAERATGLEFILVVF